MLSSNKKPVHKPCFFDPSTFQRQSFSIPEKIVFYMAKNCTNAETFQKLIETCKYFFKVNPVVVVPNLSCSDGKWYVSNGFLKKSQVFKYDQPCNFKVWVTREFPNFSRDASQVISLIYKNDAIIVVLHSAPLKFEQFLFFVGNAKQILMTNQIIKYENGKIVQFEDMIENLPKLTTLHYEQCLDGSDINSNTVQKLMERKDFKNLSKLNLYDVSEVLDVEGMFNFIIKNKQLEVDLCYRQEISDACKEVIREYSNRLKVEEGCKSRIRFE